MIADAEELTAAHGKAATSKSQFLLWDVRGTQLTFRGSGPDYITEATAGVTDPFEMMVAAPTNLAAGWLRGTEGPMEIELDGPVLRLATPRSAIEIEVITRGDEIARLANPPQGEDLEPLGITGDLWAAMKAVTWASAANTASVSDGRFKAVHLSYGKVWGVSPATGTLALIHTELPEGVCPMVPATVAALGAIVHPEALVVADNANRLWVLEDTASWTAPLVGGDPLEDLTANPMLDRARDGQRTTLNVKQLNDALTRLDRVDVDEFAKQRAMSGRVQLKTLSETTLGLSVLVGKRRATEAIEVSGDPLSKVFLLGLLRSLVGFAEGAEELEIRHVSAANGKGGQVYICHGDREAWVSCFTNDRLEAE